jgi:hypothetical protein
VVECDLAKVEVAGSNPVSRSIIIARARGSAGESADNRSAPSPSGKAEVCKTSIPGSNPGGASNFSSEILGVCSFCGQARLNFWTQIGPNKRVASDEDPAID